MIVPIPYVLAGMGALLAVVSIPLILGKVPMNRGYGIRIRKAFVSPANWAAINSFGGKVLCVFGLLLMIFAFFTRDLAPAPRSIWAPVFLIAPLAVEGILFAILLAGFSSRLPDR